MMTMRLVLQLRKNGSMPAGRAAGGPSAAPRSRSTRRTATPMTSVSAEPVRAGPTCRAKYGRAVDADEQRRPDAGLERVQAERDGEGVGPAAKMCASRCTVRGYRPIGRDL